jgi:hypothetical protein
MENRRSAAVSRAALERRCAFSEPVLHGSRVGFNTCHADSLRNCEHQFRYAAPDLPGLAAEARARGVPDRVMISGESRSPADNATGSLTCKDQDQGIWSTIFASRGSGVRVP